MPPDPSTHEAFARHLLQPVPPPGAGRSRHLPQLVAVGVSIAIALAAVAWLLVALAPGWHLAPHTASSAAITRPTAATTPERDLTAATPGADIATPAPDTPGQAALTFARPPVQPPTPESRLRIPGIGVDAPIDVGGLGADGRMEDPKGADSVNWYNFSALPGQAGNALIAGHVDFGQRTAVFWDLHMLQPGDVVTVSSGGVDVVYTVTRLYTVPAGTTETAAIVGTRSGPPTLTLITCDGVFVASKHSYDERLIVIASLQS